MLRSLAMFFTRGNLFRSLLMLILAAHVFYMYCLARTWGGEIGFHAGQTVIAAGFGLIMLVPLLWAVTVPDWPEIYTQNIRDRRRYQRSRCTACDYDLRGIKETGETICAECGTPIAEPVPYQFTFGIFKKFILINLLAWIIGASSGEMWVFTDEVAFQREVLEASMNEEKAYFRERRWPAVGSLYWTKSLGFYTRSSE